jgi:RimJ/RimL family protein N-acetyltransferase
MISNILKTDFPLINAVLQQKQEGIVFHFSEFNFFIHKAGFSYLQLNGNNINEVLTFFLTEKSLIQYFHIYDAPKEVVDVIKKDTRFGIKYRKRIQLRFHKKNQMSFLKNLEHEFSFEKINTTNFDGLKIFNLELEKRFWKSKTDFLQNTYGVVAIDKHTKKTVAICYSSSIANNISEIDIATLPEYRGRGLAKAITVCFINFSKRRGIQVNWDCFQSNIASLRTAQSLGFEQIKEYYFLSIYNKIKRE